MLEKPSEVSTHRYSHMLWQAVQYRAEAFAAAGKHVVVTGDLNICPHPLDHCEPDMKHFYACRPDRRWLMDMLEPDGGPFVDGFRLHQPHRWQPLSVWQAAWLGPVAL